MDRIPETRPRDGRLERNPSPAAERGERREERGERERIVEREMDAASTSTTASGTSQQ